MNNNRVQFRKVQAVLSNVGMMAKQARVAASSHESCEDPPVLAFWDEAASAEGVSATSQGWQLAVVLMRSLRKYVRQHAATSLTAMNHFGANA